MKVTKEQLVEIISEEIDKALREDQSTLIMESDPMSLGQKLAIFMPDREMPDNRKKELYRNKLHGVKFNELNDMMINHKLKAEKPDASEAYLKQMKLTEPELAQLKKLILDFAADDDEYFGSREIDGQRWGRRSLTKNQKYPLNVTFNELLEVYPESNVEPINPAKLSRADKKDVRAHDAGKYVDRPTAANPVGWTSDYGDYYNK